jgi:hypothetical protein
MATQGGYGNPPVPTPITITVCGQAQPGSASISILNNGGANFNATYAFTLTFSPSCPFVNGVGNDLSLAVGNNSEPLKNPVTQQTYTFTINPAQKPGEVCPPRGDQFDVVINP